MDNMTDRRAVPAVEITHFMPMAMLRRLVEQALDEDLGRGDITSDLLVPAGLPARAVIRARSAGTIAGLGIAGLVFESVDATTRVEPLVRDGDTVSPGQDLAIVDGAAHSLLRAERVALNFVQRLSGIATLTARYVESVEGTAARIVDTRKTTPGLRALEKYAVRAGGGRNHRRDLSDAVMVKDNHMSAIAARGLSLSEALAQARDVLPHTIKIEVEVDRLDQIEPALEARADIILLDNMSPGQLREAVHMIAGRALTEASGGVNLETVKHIAATGVDLISVGALTHSAPALDIALDFTWEPGDEH
ncbi:MAG: hypothetical protein QOH59_2868 [Gemmatimonadales bacterium]|nr:hypothetical protein [Gemmatimonadales bacterium]